MSRAKIINSVWKRRITWEKDGNWRTDIFKSVLADSRLETASFHLTNGMVVNIPASELKRILEGGKTHYGDAIWGPFNINSSFKTVDGQHVEMEIQI